MSTQPHQEKIRVAVIFGGRSSEHSVSCVTASSVLEFIDRSRYEVLPIGVSPEGQWVLVADKPELLAITDGRLPQIDVADNSLVALPSDPVSRDITVHAPNMAPKTLSEVDVVLPLLHGAYGEDGTVQGLLELAGVPYVGAGVLSSAINMDKEYSKRLLASYGLPVVPHVVVRPRRWASNPDSVRMEIFELGWPVFVKPARAGSSVGVTMAAGPDELDKAIEYAQTFDPKVLVEAAVFGREIECGVLEDENGEPEASLPAEIRVKPGHDFYDFDAKYLDNSTELCVPAELDADVRTRIQTMAVEAFESMSCEGLARVDFFLVDNSQVIVNEVNTMPGFTPASMFPLMWQASGIDYPALIDRLIAAALRRPIGLR
jgi:D-alanine-D-alanine ligase